MSNDRIVVGIDVGTTKVCALIAEVSDDDHLEVIGVGIVDPATHDGLDELARRGGEPRPGASPAYYPAGAAAELSAALGDIAGPRTLCTWLLPRPSHDPSELGVTVDGLAAPYDAGNANGWNLAAGGSALEFFGPWCDSLRAGRFSTVSVRYGCMIP